MNLLIAHRYRTWRRAGFAPADALTRARIGRHAPHHTRASLTRPDDPARPWCLVGDPAGVGFFDHANANDIVNIDHTGWFADAYYDPKAECYIIDPSPTYANPGEYVSSFDGPDVIGPAYDADRMAQRYAQDARWYSEAWTAGQAYGNTLERVREAHNDMREALRQGATSAARRIHADACALIAEARAIREGTDASHTWLA